MCQVAEINVALCGERAERVCKGAKEFLTRANDKSCFLEKMKHIGLIMLVSSLFQQNADFMTKSKKFNIPVVIDLEICFCIKLRTLIVTPAF